MRGLLVAIALTSPLAAHADKERHEVSADELAAAKRAKLSCANLTKLATKHGELDGAPTLLAAATKACRRDGWKLEMLACSIRETSIQLCEPQLTAKQKERLEADLEKVAFDHFAENNARWRNIARKNGVLHEPQPAPPAPVVEERKTRRGGHALPPIYDRLRDADGPVAGLAGFAIKRKPDLTRCGGVAIEIVRDPKASTSDPVAALFAHEAPTGLDFSRHKVNESKRRLGVHEQQVHALVKSATSSKVRSRIALAHFRAASLLARVEIPADLRTADGARAYCDDAQDRAELHVLAGDAALK